MIIYEKEVRPGIFNIAVDASTDLQGIPHLIQLCQDFKTTAEIKTTVGWFYIPEATTDFLVALKLSS